jgi:hypothetical protein
MESAKARYRYATSAMAPPFGSTVTMLMSAWRRCDCISRAISAVEPRATTFMSPLMLSSSLYSMFQS